MAAAQPNVLRSPRTNLNRLLDQDEALQAAGSDARRERVELVRRLDAEDKLRRRKLYLVLDLDETLVYSQRLAPDAAPKGTKITVRGSPFDMVVRPGLEQFLRVTSQSYVVYMYTMGDEDYAKAVLRVIDPRNVYFSGGVCCWNPQESRTHKELGRVVCEPSMALIVDDSPDVWSRDLRNLCLTRRYVGDQSDDGLQLLCSQLDAVHRTFYGGGADPAEWVLGDAARKPPDVREILCGMRGNELAGCRISFTGVVSEQTDDSLAAQPLCILVQLFGGEVTTNVDESTHLVARNKAGWKHSAKIRGAAQRAQARIRARCAPLTRGPLARRAPNLRCRSVATRRVRRGAGGLCGVGAGRACVARGNASSSRMHVIRRRPRAMLALCAPLMRASPRPFAER